MLKLFAFLSCTTSCKCLLYALIVYVYALLSHKKYKSVMYHFIYSSTFLTPLSNLNKCTDNKNFKQFKCNFKTTYTVFCYKRCLRFSSSCIDRIRTFTVSTIFPRCREYFSGLSVKLKKTIIIHSHMMRM